MRSHIRKTFPAHGSERAYILSATILTDCPLIVNQNGFPDNKKRNRCALFPLCILYLVPYPQNRTLNSDLSRSSRPFQVLSAPSVLWLSPRPISIHQLHALLHFHLKPIYLILSKGSYLLGYLILRGASRLDAFSVYPFRTWLLCHGSGSQQIHQRSVHPGPLVLRTAPLKYPPPAPDRDRTVSRRSEPSSRTALMGEQPNPWDLLQPQDAMSRHRGAKPLRRCELLGVISLLSPG